MAQDIPFLFQCHPVQVVYDRHDRLAGLVLANRSYRLDRAVCCVDLNQVEIDGSGAMLVWTTRSVAFWIKGCTRLSLI